MSPTVTPRSALDRHASRIGHFSKHGAAPEHAPNGHPIRLTTGMRYDQLLKYIERRPSLSILEIGVAQAANLLRMMAYGHKLGGTPKYSGIDLFDSLTDDAMARSHCVEAKRPASRHDTMNLVRRVLGDTLAMQVLLFEGLSSHVLEVLSAQGLVYDLIFVDGDHSYEGVAADWHFAQRLLAPGGTVVFDDFPNWGILPIIAEIDRRVWSVKPLEHVDVFEKQSTASNPGHRRMHQLVEVTRRFPLPQP